MLIKGDTAKFQFSYFYNGAPISSREWMGLPIGGRIFTYLISNNKLIEVSDGRWTSSGTFFDENFRCDLIGKEIFYAIKKKDTSIEPCLRSLLKEIIQIFLLVA